MKFFRFSAIITVLSLIMFGFSGCKSDSAVNDAVKKVAYVSSCGDVNDGGFNEYSYKGVKKFCKENDIKHTYFIPNRDTDADRIQMIEIAIGSGYNVLMLTGYQFSGCLVEIANDYPDVKFIVLDVSEESLIAAGAEKIPDNVVCIDFHSEQSGFLAGYTAVKLGYTKLGFLGGLAASTIKKFGYGFLNGVDTASKELGIKTEVKYVYAGQFFPDSDITAMMETWYKSGTEAVFICGGGIYTSACEAAQKYNGKVIGVDSDQSKEIDSKYNEGMTITSAMKDVENTAFHVLDYILNQNLWNEMHGTCRLLGLESADDYSENFVQLPVGTTQWDDEKFSLKDYNEIVRKIVDKKITIFDGIEDPPEMENVDYKFYGNIKG